MSQRAGRKPALFVAMRSHSLHRFISAAILIGLCALGRANDVVPRMLLLDAALAGSTVITVGERGTILHSVDSGKTWQSAETGVVATLTGISFAPDQRHGWAVGHDALILGTTDAGLTWRKLYQGENLETTFLDVCAIDEQRVLAVGAYGRCLATTDGGQTWTPRKLLDDELHLNRITRGPTGTLYVAGERGTLMRSSDDGATWQRLVSPYDGSFFGILPLDRRTLIAYGLRGRLFRSADDGATWTPVPNDQPVLLATAVKLRSNFIVLAGQARAQFISRDYAQSIAPFPAPLASAVAEVLEAPDGALLTFGEAGATRLPSPQ